jgi:2-polyprenyl-6-methoxyphenol hydroxylase-like FAD-dependent oxidoreductase
MKIETTAERPMTNPNVRGIAMRTSKKVVIVGGGIGGLTAAVSLRRHGHEVVVLERRATAEEAGAGISLWPNAMRILHDLGLGPALEASAISDGRATIRTRRGRHLSASEMGAIERRFAAPLSVVHRRHLLDVLRTAVGDDTLRLGSTCIGATQDEQAASALLADGGQVEGDVIVAADGVGSRLREALLGPAAPRATGIVAWRAVVAANGFDVAAVTGEAWGRGQLFGAARLTQNQLYWFASARAPESADRSQHAERESLRARFADWHAPIPAIIDSTPPETIIRTPLRDIGPLATWVSGRVALLGDAAHAMLPNLGQGGCQAIEDAAALATALANGAEVRDALSAYERSRKPRAEKIARQSRQMSGLAHQRNPAAVALRNVAMRAAPAAATLRRLDDLVGRPPQVAAADANST